jgi:malate synthase
VNEQGLNSVQGPRTEKGLRTNISVGLTYLEAWLGGSGCIPIHSMMEDAATAEIARTQVRGSPGS